MENLPFLTNGQTSDQPSLRNDRPPPSENEWPRVQPEQRDALDFLRTNPMGLVLLGIVIGVLLANMRPVIIQSTK